MPSDCCYFVDKAAAADAAPALYYFGSILHCFAVFTQNLGQTHNPIIEALNGWMKDELFLDFDLAHTQDVPALLDQYVFYFNNKRQHAALGYKSPVQYKTELGFR